MTINKKKRKRKCFIKDQKMKVRFMFLLNQSKTYTLFILVNFRKLLRHVNNKNLPQNHKL